MTSNKIIKICAFTGTRADYPRIKSVLEKLRTHKLFDLKLVVTGSHLLKSSGNTINDIIEDGFYINAKVKMFNEPLDDSLAGNAKAFVKCADGIINAIGKIKPKVALVTVDRVETLAIGSICALMNIPIIHIQGGEISGTIDESIRHAVSKLSHFHFVATKISAKRLIQMGEKPSNVFHVGCPYTDILEKEINKKNNFKNLQSNLKIKNKFCIFIMHSVTTNLNEAKILFKKVCNAIKKISQTYEVLSFVPNTDPGCNYILKNIKKLKNIKIIKNLRSEDFILLLRNAEFMIGNSSSGIREAASFKLPVINIGSRQSGRERSNNVIDSDFCEKKILKKLSFIENDKNFQKKLKNCKNIYGDGKVSERIIKKMVKLDYNNVIEKKFFNI